jgi:hypothetical protein
MRWQVIAPQQTITGADVMHVQRRRGRGVVDSGEEMATHHQPDGRVGGSGDAGRGFGGGAENPFQVFEVSRFGTFKMQWTTCERCG